MRDLYDVRKAYTRGDHITTEEMKEHLPRIDDSVTTLMKLGEEFRLVWKELHYMSLNFRDWLRARGEQVD